MILFRSLDTTVDDLIREFEDGWKPEPNGYARKLVEFCGSKALSSICCYLEGKINDGSFSRFTFDMMLAWEKTSSGEEELGSYSEGIAKENEDTKMPLREPVEVQDDVSLFYSDVMPLLVDDEPSVAEDAFVWLGSLAPLPCDVINGRFTFEALTTSTAYRFHFPAYDKFLKEIDKCVKYLQKQPTPTGVELADDEFVLHMEGTAKTQRVVRHIGGTSWPGRLTLTNYALYFEASGVISYENALKVDLSKDVDHSVNRASTGPWGVPIFDKAVVYKSSQLSESLVLEFPEMTGSTRREHWLSLIKEVILLHKFLSNFKILSPLQAWETHSRTILGIIRLHAVREMLRISPPIPTSFLIFSLFDELPKGDLVLEELANVINQFSTTHPCSASSILKSLDICHLSIPLVEVKEDVDQELARDLAKNISRLESLEGTINQVRVETKEANIAKATVEGLKEEGISDSFVILTELLSPLKSVIPRTQQIISWQKPLISVLVLVTSLIITYKDWIGKAIAAAMVYGVGKMIQVRRQRLADRCKEIVIFTGSDQRIVESIVSAQHGLQSVHSMVQTANIAILKILSIVLSKTRKHADQVMMVMIVAAIVLAVIPIKLIIMGSILYVFIINSKIGKCMESGQSDRRLREWWDTIPAIPVRTVDKIPPSL
ncbi:hypothetical protein GIB67_038493 [Kingdonia uniflora]|uniref:Uncharacterized protein n=1 Tax=Kingdonia uniflora TaxID=39325 RepID=A0A7J7NPA2_9MAGN|nr:hypothetical protein GIB67_038493 [Kingdonia uniflora]